MRKTFVDKVLELMTHESDIIFLTGDLGFGSFEPIQSNFPDRFYNMGIAEQNMIGVASGLCLSGKKVILYSIANFATLRVLEQIRNYLIYHKNHVLIVNGGGGFCYGQLGYTHHSIEDVSVLRALPEIQIYAPCNEENLSSVMHKWLNNKSVGYLRLEKSFCAKLKNRNDITYIDDVIIVGEINSKHFIISYGTISDEGIQAKDEALELYNIDVSILILSNLRNIDDSLLKLLTPGCNIIFIEENAINGGIGELFLSKAISLGLNIEKYNILGVKNIISETVGDQDYMRSIHGITKVQLLQLLQTS